MHDPHGFNSIRKERQKNIRVTHQSSKGREAEQKEVESGQRYIFANSIDGQREVCFGQIEG